jgi:cytidylate kinase
MQTPDSSTTPPVSSHAPASLQTIAIDGPAGSGKSTIGAALAQRLGFLYFDTGIMYRCVALAAWRNNVAPADQRAVTDLSERIKIEVKPPHVADGRQYTVLMDGMDVTWALRNKGVEAHVSTVAAYPGVREAMVRQQRAVAAVAGRIVMCGRDIGTVVLPDADVKIYLNPGPEERARRRFEELRARGVETSYEEVLIGVRKRDEIDMTRATSPLRPAEDAIIFDSSGLDVDQAIDRIYAIVIKHAAR